MSGKSRRLILSVLLSVGLTATAMPMQRGIHKLPQPPKTTAAHQELDLLLEKFLNGNMDEIEIPKPDEYQAINVQPVIGHDDDDDRNDASENQEPTGQGPIDEVADTYNLITERNHDHIGGVKSTETENRSRNSVSAQAGVNPQPADAPSEKMLELFNAIEQEESMVDQELHLEHKDDAPSRSRSKAVSSARIQGLFDAIDYARELEPQSGKSFTGEIDDVNPYENQAASVQPVISDRNHVPVNQEPADELDETSKKRSREVQERMDYGGPTTLIPVTYTTVGKETEFPAEIERLKSILPRKYDTSTQKNTVRSAIKFIDEMNGEKTMLQEPDELEHPDIAALSHAKMIYLIANLVSRLPGNLKLHSGGNKKVLPGHLTRNRAIFEARHYIFALKNARKPKSVKSNPELNDEQALRDMGELHNTDESLGYAQRRDDRETLDPPLKRLKFKLPPKFANNQQQTTITQKPLLYSFVPITSVPQQQLFKLAAQFAPRANAIPDISQSTNQHPGPLTNSYAESTIGLSVPLAPQLQLGPTLQYAPATTTNYGQINHAIDHTVPGSFLSGNSEAERGPKIPWQQQNQYILKSIWDLSKFLPSRYNPKTRNDVLIAVCNYIDESTGKVKEGISLYPKGSFRNNDIWTNENFKLLYRQLARRLPDHPQLSIDSPNGITKYELMDRVRAYIISLQK